MIRKAVRVTAEQGHASVNVVDLDRYLNEWEQALPADNRPVDQLTLDRLRAQFDEAMAREERRHRGKLAEFEAALVAGRRAVQSALLVNGGAATALLAFVGHLATAGTSASRAAVPQLATSRFLYVAGLFAAVLSAGSVYVAQARYFKDKNEAGDWFNIISITFVILSYVLFALASWAAYAVFRSL